MGFRGKWWKVEGDRVGQDAFTIEVIGFPDLTPAEAAEALARQLGIPVEKASEHLDRLPYVVKVGVPAAGAQQVARSLLSAGADVRLVHDASGKERVYEARAASRAKAEAVQSRAQVSLPPGPRPPDDKQVAATCPSCNFQVPAGKETCPRCGWNESRRQRRCTKCDGIVRLGGTRTGGSGAVSTIVGLVLGAVSFAACFYAGYRYGLRASSAAVFVFASIGLAVLTLLLDARCESCHQPARRAFLRPEERGQLRLKRILAASGSVLCLVIAVLLGYVFFTNPILSHRSERGIYSAVLPVTHRDVDRDELQVNTILGRIEADMYAAINERQQVALFALTHVAIPDAMQSDVVSREDQVALMRSSVDGAASNMGCKVIEEHELAYLDYPGLEATFSGTYQDRPVNGRIRVFLFGVELVMLMFAGHAEDVVSHPDALRFMDSFRYAP